MKLAWFTNVGGVPSRTYRATWAMSRVYWVSVLPPIHLAEDAAPVPVFQSAVGYRGLRFFAQFHVDGGQGHHLGRIGHVLLLEYMLGLEELGCLDESFLHLVRPLVIVFQFKIQKRVASCSRCLALGSPAYLGVSPVSGPPGFSVGRWPAGSGRLRRLAAYPEKEYMRFLRRSQSSLREKTSVSAAKEAVTSSKTFSATPPMLTFSNTVQTGFLGSFLL